MAAVLLEDLIERAPEIVSAIALIGIVLLAPLFFSQRRDVRRMRAWMEREPGHPAADIAASEAILDRAEVDLEQLLDEEPATETTPVTGAAAVRVTSERPALERVTMERAALEPHPRWRRFATSATRPRVLIVLGVVALLLAGGAIVLSEGILDGDPAEQVEQGGRLDPAEITVAVLNGTSVNGLASTVGSDIESNGYMLGTITNTAPGIERTLVLYAEDQKPSAQKVSSVLGLDPKDVEPIDRESRLLAGDDADVIVIAGEDRAQP